MVTLISFGFKHGEPPLAQLIVDVRKLRNPHRDPRLRRLNGLDLAVIRDVSTAPGFIDLFSSTIAAILNLGVDPVVAVGCTGGRHRSVAFVTELANTLLYWGMTVTIKHRDINKD